MRKLRSKFSHTLKFKVNSISNMIPKMKILIISLSLIFISRQTLAEEIEVDHSEDDRFDGINNHDALSRNPAVQNFTVCLVIDLLKSFEKKKKILLLFSRVK